MKKPPRERWLGSLLQSGDGGEGVEGVFEGLAFLVGEDVAEDEGTLSPLILPSPGGIVGLQDEAQEAVLGFGDDDLGDVAAFDGVIGIGTGLGLCALHHFKQ